MGNFLLDRRGGNPLSDAVRAMRGDPQGLYDRLYGTDGRFRALADSVRGKTPEQAFREHGLDFDEVSKAFGQGRK